MKNLQQLKKWVTVEKAKAGMNQETDKNNSQDYFLGKWVAFDEVETKLNLLSAQQHSEPQPQLQQAHVIRPLPVPKVERCSSCQMFEQRESGYRCKLWQENALITYPDEQYCERWEAMA